MMLVFGAILPLVACSSGPSAGARTVTVVHRNAPPVAVIRGEADGRGTCRVFHGPVTFEGIGPGRLDVTMVTTGVDGATGLETRITRLVFLSSADRSQLVVEEVAEYPAAGPTIVTAEAVTRPIIGGSGAWVGARGSVETTHLEDGSWKHVFTLLP